MPEPACVTITDQELKRGLEGFERQSVNCVSFITCNERKPLLKYAKIVKMVMLLTETPIAGKSF